ncbi:MAG: hypothetical protein HY851_02380, partial [candidate division Zixibacteria bacterium]|nr:hypothetical protein [candidate division Zixibacteria bacterium]
MATHAATSGADLAAAMDRIENAELDTTTAGSTAGLTLDHKDFSLQMDSGWGAFFESVTIDSVKHAFALYLEGKGRFRFFPTPAVERGQMNRFFKTDSLDRPFEKAVILLGDSLSAVVAKSLKPLT